MANEGFWHGNGRKLPRPLLIAKEIPEETFNPSLRALIKRCLPRPEPPSHTFRLTQSDQIELNRKRRAQGLPEFPISEGKGKVSAKVEARLRKTLQEVTSKVNLWSKRLDCCGCGCEKRTAATPSHPLRPALNGRSINVVDTSAYLAQNANDLQSRFGCTLRRSNAFRRTGSTIRRSVDIRRRLSAASRDDVRSLELLTPANRDFDPMQSIAEDGAEQTKNFEKDGEDHSVVANAVGEARLLIRSFFLNWNQSRRARSRSGSSSTTIKSCDCVDADNNFLQQTHIARVPNHAVQVHRSARQRSQRAVVIPGDSDDHLTGLASVDDSSRKRQYQEVDRVWWK